MDLAFNFAINYIQIVTWNDYGEGTMTKPTREFGYSFLTTLLKKMGIKHTLADLKQVTKLYHQRKYYSSNITKIAQIQQEFWCRLNNKRAEIIFTATN